MVPDDPETLLTRSENAAALTEAGSSLVTTTTSPGSRAWTPRQSRSIVRPCARPLLAVQLVAPTGLQRLFLERQILAVCRDPRRVVYLGDEMPPRNHYGVCRRRTIFPYEAAHLAEHWTRCTDFQKYDGRTKTWRSIDCPEKLATAYMRHNMVNSNSLRLAHGTASRAKTQYACPPQAARLVS